MVIVEGARVQHRPQRDRRARADTGVLLLPGEPLHAQRQARDVSLVGSSRGQDARRALCLTFVVWVRANDGPSKTCARKRTQHDVPEVGFLKLGDRFVVATDGATKERSVDLDREVVGALADVRVARAGRRVELGELGEVVAVEVVGLDDNRNRPQVVQV